MRTTSAFSVLRASMRRVLESTTISDVRFGRLPSAVEHPDDPHLFACFFQIRRAFHYIFRNILGGSLPAARLRAAVWQSIFTRDLRRYRRTLYQRMDDIATLMLDFLDRKLPRK